MGSVSVSRNTLRNGNWTESKPASAERFAGDPGYQRVPRALFHRRDPVKLPGGKDQPRSPRPFGGHGFAAHRNFQIAAAIDGGIRELDDDGELAVAGGAAADILMPAV